MFSDAARSHGSGYVETVMRGVARTSTSLPFKVLDVEGPEGNMDQYVIQIRKSKSRKNQDLIFGFLRETYDGHTSGSVRSATVYESRESAENAAASFVLQNPTYMERVIIKKVEEYMPIHTRRR